MIYIKIIFLNTIVAFIRLLYYFHLECLPAASILWIQLTRYTSHELLAGDPGIVVPNHVMAAKGQPANKSMTQNSIDWFQLKSTRISGAVKSVGKTR